MAHYSHLKSSAARKFSKVRKSRAQAHLSKSLREAIADPEVARAAVQKRTESHQQHVAASQKFEKGCHVMTPDCGEGVVDGKSLRGTIEVTVAGMRRVRAYTPEVLKIIE